MENEYIVYVQTNSSGIITAINSSAFLADLSGWMQVDEGEGDKFHHAQGSYLEKGLMDENGCYNYKLVDGIVVERTTEEKQPEITSKTNAERIAELKSQLADTDYAIIKIAEGAATVEEYATLIAQRQAWRTEINQLDG